VASQDIDPIDGPRTDEFAYFHRVLSAREVPNRDEPWPAIAKFALSFDAYAAYGFQGTAALANEARRAFAVTGEVPESLAVLRACLFFEQRRGHHTGQEHVATYIAALIEGIRALAPSDD